MAFTQKTWKDRLVEYAGRRKITNTSTNEAQIVDVERAEGTVSEEGSAFSAANMNDLEQRVADEFGEINKKIDTRMGKGMTNYSGLTLAAALTAHFANDFTEYNSYSFQTQTSDGYFYVTGFRSTNQAHGIASQSNGTVSYHFYISSVSGGADAVLKKWGNGALDLIWENPDPTQTFAAQTISLDLSAYKSVFILTRYSNTQSTYPTYAQIAVGSSGLVYVPADNGDLMSCRTVTVKAESIAFTTSAYKGKISGDGGGIYAIPIAIYGV